MEMGGAPGVHGVITRLTCENLAVARGGRTLFGGLSFAVEAGEAVALVGANGSGKTSLLRAVAGLIRPEGGRIAFAGEGGWRPRRRARPACTCSDTRTG